MIAFAREFIALAKDRGRPVRPDDADRPDVGVDDPDQRNARLQEHLDLLVDLVSQVIGEITSTIRSGTTRSQPRAS